MIPLPFDRIIRTLSGQRLVIASTASLITTWMVNSLLGFAFWFVATRSFSPEAVGLASATVSASMLIGRLTVSGLGTSLAGLMSSFIGDRAGLVASALLVAGAIGATLALVFAVVAHFIWPEYQPLVAQPSYVLLFMIGGGLTAVAVVLDQVLIGLHRHDLQLFRNIVFAAGKLVLLVVAALFLGGIAGGAMLIFGVWALGDASAVLALAGYLKARLPQQPVVPQWGTVLGLTRSAVGQQAISACRTGPALFMPILVTGMLSATSNASFYVALILTTALQVVASSATFTLYAVGARNPEALRHQLRLTLSLSTGIVLVGFVALLILGPWLLGIFGPTYVIAAGPSLPWLAACAFPLLIIDHWIALRRIRGELKGTVAILVVGAVSQIVASAVGATIDGLTGLAIGWFLAMTGTSVVMVRELFEAATSHDVDRHFSRADDLLDDDRSRPSARVADRKTAVDGIAAIVAPDLAAGPAPTTHISVFIPVRNDAAWLPGAIDSVVKQTHPDWDLIVGDNASVDDIAGLVASYRDPRIRYHRFERSATIMENWNRTAALCDGDWVVPLSADDRFRPDFLLRAAKAIEVYGPQVDHLALVVTSCRRIFPDGSSADRLWSGSKPKQAVRDGIYHPDEWLRLCTSDGQQPWSIESTVVNRTVLEESGGLLRPEIGLAADFESVMRFGAYGSVAYVTEELLDYTVRSDADGPGRFQVNRARGVRYTVDGIALQNAMYVHEQVRGLTPPERRRVLDAIARTHLQRAGQHRVLADGHGRPGAFRDVFRAVRRSPRFALRPDNLLFSFGVIFAPRRLLEYAKDRLTEHYHGKDGVVDVGQAA